MRRQASWNRYRWSTSCTFGCILFLISVFQDFTQSADVRYFLYNNDANADETQELFPGNKWSVSKSAFNRNWFTIIFTHGFGSSKDGSSAKDVTRAHLDAKRMSHFSANYIVADYSPLAGNVSGLFPALDTYHLAVSNVSVVASQVTRFLIDLVDWGMVRPESVHLIGFSIGAQIMGRVGQNFQAAKGGRKVHRITGLDPAGPCFGPGREARAISRDDAEFVDIIHTHWDHFGTDLLGGHVDFIVNNGKGPQPGCSFGGVPCKHIYANYIYIDSIKRSRLGCQLPDGTTPKNMTIPSVCNNPVVMGPWTQTMVTGVFHVNARDLKPPPSAQNDGPSSGYPPQEDWTWVFISCKPPSKLRHHRWNRRRLGSYQTSSPARHKYRPVLSIDIPFPTARIRG